MIAEMKPWPIKNVVFEGIGVLTIPEDITAYEVAHIAIMLAHASGGTFVSYREYVSRHNLWRLFK